jgi:hypothetical protein
MTNGEKEIKEEEQISTQQVPEPQPAPEVQHAPTSKKSSINPIIIVIGVLAVCCIGVGVLIFAGALSLDEWSGPTYNNETIGGHVFQIPTEFKRDSSTSAKDYIQFKNDNSQFLRILYFTEEYELYSFALVLASELGTDGNRLDISGTPAYKYNTVDTDGTGQSMYTYAMNIQGKTFVISLSKNIQNPEEFLANVTNI